MANSDIIVDDKSNKPSAMNQSGAPATHVDALASWIIERVDAWTRYRDQNHKENWNEYYRLWRGVWTKQDKTRSSERSRIISPALQQAIEAAVSELEEATFGRVRWIDIEDDRADQQPQDVEFLNKQLLEDFEMDGVKSAISETYLNGALYGTGVAKIVVDETKEMALDPNAPVIPGAPPQIMPISRVAIKLIPIEPMNFAIDPIARSIDEALGCAHIMLVPRHTISAKQEAGIYNKGYFGIAPETADDVRNTSGRGEFADVSPDDKVKIVEYHGLVPAKYLKKKAEVVNLFEQEEEENNPVSADGDELVESIITIANDSFVLKAVRNPHMMKDRSIIAYQHDTVPNRFYGRGIAEKGYNSQKALDAEMRARIDGLGFANNPMMAVDIASLPRGQNSGMSVYPGKTIITNGAPNQSIMPIQFNGPDPNTYRQTGELERMIQMGTGSMDSATPTGINPRNSTASGMSMIMAGAIKRQKRTMHNIERHFLDPLVKKSLWRYMDFDPERYPVGDFKFTVHSSMGIMAREFEQQQLSNLLNTVPAASPAYWLILDSIYENSSLNNKEQTRQMIQQQLQQAMQPPKPEDNPEIKLKQRELELKEKELDDKMFMEAQAHIRLTKHAETDEMRTKYELGMGMAQKQIDLEKAKSGRLEAESRSLMNLAKAEAEEVGTQIKSYSAKLAEIQNSAEQNIGSIGDLRNQVQSVMDAIEQISARQMNMDQTEDMIGDIQKAQAEQQKQQTSQMAPEQQAPQEMMPQEGTSPEMGYSAMADAGAAMGMEQEQSLIPPTEGNI